MANKPFGTCINAVLRTAFSSLLSLMLVALLVPYAAFADGESGGVDYQEQEVTTAVGDTEFAGFAAPSPIQNGVDDSSNVGSNNSAKILTGDHESSVGSPPDGEGSYGGTEVLAAMAAPLPYVPEEFDASEASSAVIGKPRAEGGLVYTGEEQQGVPEGEGYELSGDYRATEAGSYTAVVTLKGGYAWADGSTAPVEVAWSIAKVELKAILVGSSFLVGNEPMEAVVDVVGFVNGETAETAKGYKAPYAKLPERWIAGKEFYDITPEGGEAANYSFAYVKGRLARIAKNASVAGHSSKELPTGTYRVAANLAMLTPLGIYGYTTNPFNPEGIGGNPGVPDQPTKEFNATLVVGEDGSRILSFDLVNPVFTVQHLVSGDDVRVLDVKVGSIEYKENDPSYQAGINERGVSSRIRKVVLGLENWSGEYTLSSESRTYATTLRSWYGMPLKVTVDLAGAAAAFTGEFEKDYVDEATEIVVKARASKDSTIIEALDSASLRVDKLLSGSEREHALAQLDTRYEELTGFDLYRVALVSGGDELAADADVEFEVSVPTGTSGARVHAIGGTGLRDAGEASAGEAVSFTTRSLGLVARVGLSEGKTWGWSRTVEDPDTGVSLMFSTDPSALVRFLGVATPDQARQMLDWAATYFKARAARLVDGDMVRSAQRLITEQEGLYGARVQSLYGAGISMFSASPYSNQNFLSFDVGNGKSLLKASLPVDGDALSFYVVSGTAAELTSVKKIDASVLGDTALVDIIGKDELHEEVANKGIAASESFWNAGMNDLSHDSKPLSYIAVVSLQKIDKPRAEGGLVYTGGEQQGVPEGEGYELSGDYRATEAGSYTAVATLKGGYAWADGSTAPVEVAWSIAKASVPLTPGTYTITANLSMPGAYNPLIPGLTVYANNPNNPFGAYDYNDPSEVGGKVPSDPQSMNATLTVAADGTRTLDLHLKNPVFTVQLLGTCAKLPRVWTQRVQPANPAVWTYGKYPDRVARVGAVLTDELVSGTASYAFKGSKLYAVPLDRDIEPVGDVALRLEVDYSSAKKVSESTESAFPEPMPSPNPNPVPAPVPTPQPSPGGMGNEAAVAAEGGRLAAGTYTVSGNIWCDKSVTGLPLNPHFTNSGFPPKDPVSANAVLTVDSSGRAKARIPVVIQSRIMTVESVWGNGVSFDGTHVTVDLGTPRPGQTVFSGTCTARVHIGDLAMTIGGLIFQGKRDHTWTANWRVDLGSSLPASGGGKVPEAARSLLAGEGDKASAQDAEEAASKALEDVESAAVATRSSGVTSSSSPAQEGIASEKGSFGGVPVAALAVAGAVLAAGAVGGVLYTRRKRR